MRDRSILSVLKSGPSLPINRDLGPGQFSTLYLSNFERQIFTDIVPILEDSQPLQARRAGVSGSWT